MNQAQYPPSAETTAKQHERWLTLIDMLYLLQLFAVYLFSAIYPFFGLAYGILFMSGGLTPRTKRIGRICLILGVINLAICFLFVIVIIFLSLTGILAALGD